MWKRTSRHSDPPEADPVRLSAQLVVEQGVLAEGQRPRTRHRIAQVQRVGPTAVATLTVTELTQRKGLEMLADLLDDLGQTNAAQYVLDIQNVQLVDETCLACLVNALNAFCSDGGKIALANPLSSIQYLFKMTELERIFPICTDVMAAIHALERRPGRG